MHYFLLTFVFLWFAFVAPLRVVLLTAACCLAIAFGVRLVAHAIAGVSVGYGKAITAVLLSAFLLLLTLLLIAGGFRDMSWIKFMALNPLSILFMLVASYVVGYHLCLGTQLWASSVIALLSAVITVGVIFSARSMIA
ncbi:hypothetical protein [Viridibacterium curvum]|uniref:Integral membrane protein n=1 Tax=Viridibacterium curvum TaxID=1101404 RepID=A0ABP9QL29_9RHOO